MKCLFNLHEVSFVIEYYENLNEMNVVGLMHVSDANHEGLECQGKKIHERTALLIFFHSKVLFSSCLIAYK